MQIVNKPFIVDGFKFDAAIDYPRVLHPSCVYNAHKGFIPTELYCCDHPEWDIYLFYTQDDPTNKQIIDNIHKFIDERKDTNCYGCLESNDEDIEMNYEAPCDYDDFIEEDENPDAYPTTVYAVQSFYAIDGIEVIKNESLYYHRDEAVSDMCKLVRWDTSNNLSYRIIEKGII